MSFIRSFVEWVFFLKGMLYVKYFQFFINTSNCLLIFVWSGVCKCSWKIGRNCKSRTVSFFISWNVTTTDFFFFNLNDQLWCSVPKIVLNHIRKHLNMHMQEADYRLQYICVIFSLIHKSPSLIWNKTTPLTETTTEVFSTLCKFGDYVAVRRENLDILYCRISEFSFHIFWETWLIART